ncbi:hypothetical protein FIV42_04635 [Persicimonas caeni]|uniref:Dystroglycan-type cadherin-like domain-containing protein n=1 Tax=Persicimonas caeni TaxID=2292766 RepID=A0A4Y6PPX0_PERCE|nr:Ig-like domain-containing protein [Persicimonas caeni]QDG50047.1 hypothetical protein FIV42_04635 [Persicimonas caeni]QED31268.1 hypothetical protein FRD00_04630 [Persicimonas caeni]
MRFSRRSFLILWCAVVCASVFSSGCHEAPEPASGDLSPASASRSVALTPQFEVGNPTFVSSPDTEFAPDLAFDGTNYWVLAERHTYDPRGVITRVDPQGNLLETEPLTLADGMFHREIACGTSTCMVVSVRYGNPTALVFTRFAFDGSLLGTSEHELPTHAIVGKWRRPIDLAFDGSRYLVVWDQELDSAIQNIPNPPVQGIHALRVSETGAVVDAAAIAVGPDAQESGRPEVIAGTTNSLVAWSGDQLGEISAARLSHQGVVLDDVPLSIVTDGAFVGLAYGDSRFAVATAQYRSFETDCVGVSMIDETSGGASSTQVPTTCVFETSSIDANALDAAISHDGSHFVVAMLELTRSRTRTVVTRLAPDGSVTGEVEIGNGEYRRLNVPTGPGGYRSIGAKVELVSSQGQSLLTWRNDDDILAARLPQTGATPDAGGFPVFVNEADRIRPRAAAGRGQHMLVWTQLAGDYPETFDVYGTRVFGDGTLLDTDPIPIATGVSRQINPHVAYGGGTYLVVWEDADSNTVYSRRVDADTGDLLDSGPLAVASSGPSKSEPALAYGGGEFLIAWSDGRDDEDGCGVFATRVSSDGQARAVGELEFTNLYACPRRVAATFGAHHFLLAWSAAAPAPGPDYEVRAARISPAGALLDPSGFDVSGEDIFLSQLSATFDGEHFLVVWTPYSDDTAFGARIARDASLVDPAGVPLFDASEQPASEPHLAFNGASHLATWISHEHRDEERMRARLIALDLSTSALDVLTVRERTGPTDSPAVAAAGPARFLLVDDELPSIDGRLRIVGRYVDAPAPLTALHQSVTTPEDTPLDIFLGGYDSTGAALTFSIDSPPEHGTLAGTPPNLTYTPAPDYVGPDSLEFRVTNPAGEADTAHVWITVRERPEPPPPPEDADPRLVPPTPEPGTQFTLWEGDELSFDIEAVDPDGHELTYEVRPLPAAHVDPQTATFTWTPTWRDLGRHTLEIRATSADGDYDAREVSVQVLGAHSDDDGISDSRETEHGLDPTTEDSDGDGLDDAAEWGPNDDTPVDTDGDGLADAIDPDSDNDGVADGQDACRLQSGAGVDGCPTPDRVDWGAHDRASPAGCGCQSTAPAVPGSGAVLLVVLVGVRSLRRERSR